MEIGRIMNCYVDKDMGIIGEEDMQKFSVVIPIIEEDNELKLLFELRAYNLRNQPGEISFPGGRIEKDEDSKAAAIRETCEELGLIASDIEILGAEKILVTQHSRIIYPYIAKIKNPEQIKPSVMEVDHIFKVPIDFFINTKPTIKSVRIITVPSEDFPFEDIYKGKEYKWLEGKNNIYFYKYMNYTIWGLTARILHQFINRISEMERKI